MRLPRKFKEYLNEGVIKKLSPDKSRARFLAGESKNSLEGIKEIVQKLGINSKNANSVVKNCYDIIMEMIRARLLLDGYNSSGLNAHEAEVSYLAEMGGTFEENEIAFLNELRYLRNGITYYGKILDEHYAQKAFNFLVKIYPMLEKSLKGLD